MTRQRIAIIGAGFAGMAACWELISTSRSAEVVLFDKLLPGRGTSGLSSGMLHPYPGKRALKSWRADEGMAATQLLLEIASKAAGKPVYQANGVLRLPINSEQRGYFERCAQSSEAVEWWEEERCRKMLPGSLAWEGIFIRNGLTVDPVAYLNGLWKACASKGARFVQQGILSLDQLREFDTILVATGAAAEELVGPIDPKIHPVKGQILILRWPAELPPPPMTITCQQHLVLLPGGGQCMVGATFEHPPFSQEEEIEMVCRAVSAQKGVADDLLGERRQVARIATNPWSEPMDEERDGRDGPCSRRASPQLFEHLRRTLLSNLARLYPQLLQAEIIERRVGVRASLSSHSPPSLVQVSEKVWRFAGLGSKGLLYHALLAKEQIAQYLQLN